MTAAERTYTAELLAARNLAISAKSHELLGEIEIAAILRQASRRAIRRAEAAFPPSVAREVIVSGGLDRIDSSELRPIAHEPKPRRASVAGVLGFLAWLATTPQNW